jgi:hypothetical protein
VTDEQESAVIERAIGECLDDDCIVTGFVVVATFIDGDGDPYVFSRAAEGQAHATTLGMLEFGRIGLHREVAALFEDEP